MRALQKARTLYAIQRLKKAVKDTALLGIVSTHEDYIRMEPEAFLNTFDSYQERKAFSSVRSNYCLVTYETHYKGMRIIAHDSMEVDRNEKS